MEESDPELFARIRAAGRRRAAGRWSAAGGWSRTATCPSAESFVRQGLYGQRFLHEPVRRHGHGRDERRPVRPPRDAAADPARSGHGLVLLPAAGAAREQPERTLRSGGRRRTARGCSPTASRTSTAARPGTCPARSTRRSAALDRTLGDAHGLLRGRQPRRRPDPGEHRVDPPLRPHGILREAEDVALRGVTSTSSSARKGGRHRLPVWTDDLQHARRRAATRRTPASSLAASRAGRGAVRRAVGSGRCPAATTSPTRARTSTRAWKQILFNQFHDVLPGSAIESAYDDARDQLGEAVAIAKRIITRVQNSDRPTQVDDPARGRHPAGRSCSTRTRGR